MAVYFYHRHRAELPLRDLASRHEVSQSVVWGSARRFLLMGVVPMSAGKHSPTVVRKKKKRKEKALNFKFLTQL
jgi:hypothetical protein